MSLIRDPNIPEPDDFYDELLALHQGLEKAESDALNARLILVLANQMTAMQSNGQLKCSRTGLESTNRNSPALAVRDAQRF